MAALFGGYSPNRKEPGGCTDAQLLQAAAENNPEPLIRFIKEGGDPFRVRNEDKRSLVHIAAFDGCEDALAALLQCPKAVRKVDSRDRAKRTALHLAAAAGEDGCVRRLAAGGALLDLQDEYGCTPLHLAVKWEWADAARVLLELGSDPLAEDLKGSNALDMANEVQDKDVANVLQSFEPRRNPSAWRCLLPMWGRNGARARRARAYQEAAATNASRFPAPTPPKPMQQAPPPTQEVEDEEDEEDEEEEDAPPDRQVPVVSMNDGDSDCGQGVQRPPEAADGAPVDDQWYNDWYSMDDRTLQANISAAMAEAVQQQGAYYQQLAAHEQQLMAAAAEAEAPEPVEDATDSHTATPAPDGQTGKQYRVEWHGLEPVYVNDDGNISAAEGLGAEVASQHHSTGSGSSGPPSQPERRAPLSARECTPSMEPETIGRRAGSAPPAASRAEVERPMPVPALEQPEYESAEETAEEEPATDAEAMMRGAVEAPQEQEEELTDEYVFRLRMLFEEDVKSLEFQVNWQDDMLPSVGNVKEGGESDRRGVLQGDCIAVINGVPTEGKVRADLLPLLKARPLMLEVRRCHQVADPRNPYLQLHIVLEGAGGNHGFKVASAPQLPVVAAVEADSAAARAGLVVGDQLARLGGYDGRSMAQSAIGTALQERPLNLVVRRPPLGHEAMTLGTVGRYPRESWDSDED